MAEHGPRLITRRRVLAAGALAAAYPVALEPQWFETTTTRIDLAHGAGKTVRILQLTDLHASWAVPMFSIRRAIDAGLGMKPDIVCLTGDFITTRDDFDSRAYADALRRLSAARPTYAVLGNHDGGSWAGRIGGHWTHQAVERILDDSGIELLDNRSVPAHGLTLVGVGDLWSNELLPHLAFEGVKDASRTVVLCHNPDGKDTLERYPWSLMLSGHTHGGQVRLPHNPTGWAPVRDRRFIAGLGHWNGRKIYVSRGVGSLGGVRLLCRPEVTVLDVST